MSALDEIIGHLGAARAQRAPSDDAIIAEHIDAAYTAACSLRDTKPAFDHGPDCGCTNCT